MGSMKKAQTKKSKWVVRSINLLPAEAKEYDKLKADQSGRHFVLGMLKLEKRERIKNVGR